jgi:uncharacterized membrane protein YeaQ/YmgE (transglycosylase-associated protein family)
MNRSPIRISSSRGMPRVFAISLGLVVCAFGIASFAQNEISSPAVERLGGVSKEATQAIEQTGQAAVNKVQTLWERIDERRLKNRTPDQIIAMIIMGLLVGGLLYRFGRRGQWTSIMLGLVGAFVGGIVANVTQLNLGMGPVLITYEDLLFTLIGGILMVCGGRLWTILKPFKPPIK